MWKGDNSSGVLKTKSLGVTAEVAPQSTGSPCCLTQAECMSVHSGLILLPPLSYRQDIGVTS